MLLRHYLLSVEAEAKSRKWSWWRGWDGFRALVELPVHLRTTFRVAIAVTRRRLSSAVTLQKALMIAEDFRSIGTDRRFRFGRSGPKHPASTHHCQHFARGRLQELDKAVILRLQGSQSQLLELYSAAPGNFNALVTGTSIRQSNMRITHMGSCWSVFFQDT